MAANSNPPSTFTLPQPLFWYSLADYGRLLYWMLYFPQALTLYARSLQPPAARPALPTTSNTQLLHRNSTLYQGLFIQAAILGLAILWLLLLLEWVAAKSLWNPTITVAQLGIGLFVSLLIFITLCTVVYGLAKIGVTMLFYHDLIHYILYADVLIFYFTLLLQDPLLLQSTVFAIYAGSFLGIYSGIFGRLHSQIDQSVHLSVQFVYGLTIVLLLSFLFGHFLRNLPNSQAEWVAIVLQFLLMVVTASLFGWLVLLRPDDWLLGHIRFVPRPSFNNLADLPHVTLLPFNPILNEVENCLNRNWAQGLQDTTSILEFSCQKRHVAQKIRQVLSHSTYNLMLERMVTLSENPALGQIILTPPPRPRHLWSKLFRGFERIMASPQTPSSGQQVQTKSERATAAEFRPTTLDEKVVQSAVDAFFQLRHERYSEASALFKKMRSFQKDLLHKELQLLSIVYTKLRSDDDAETYRYINAKLEILHARKELKFAVAWQALDEYKMFVRCRWVYHHCHTSQGRKLAVLSAANYLGQAVTKLAHVPPTSLLHPLKRQLEEMDVEWQKEFTWHRSRPPVPPLSTVRNPFTFIEPLHGRKLPARRQQEIQQIRTAWVVGNLQPVIIYGQRQIGKTSVILSLDRFSSSLPVQLIYVNLRHLGTELSLLSILMAISQEIDRKVGDPAPSYADLRRHPYHTFHAYIKQTCELRKKSGLMIVLDEFDHIKSMTHSPSEADDTLRFFWDLSQSEPKLGFTFITTIIPDDLTVRFDNPFMTAAQQISIGYVDTEEVRAILHQPDLEFLLYFEQSAVERIYALTCGHPYLVQAIAYCLVEQWNSGITDEAPHPEPLFTGKDVNMMINRPEFQHLNDHYCLNIWQEIARDNPQNRSLLQVLAQNQDGLTEANLNNHSINHQNLHKLCNQGIVSYEPQTAKYFVTIELFRQWILATMPVSGT